MTIPSWMDPGNPGNISRWASSLVAEHSYNTVEARLPLPILRVYETLRPSSYHFCYNEWGDVGRGE